MTTAEARQLVQKTFQNPFDKGQFVYFIKNLVNEIDESKTFHARGYVHEKYRDRVKTYERVGTYTDPEDNKIDILIVYLQKESSIDRARTTLRNFVGDYLKERGEKEAGLVAFVSPNQKDWRFSLVKMEYKIIETPSGRVKAKEEFTPAKRYSFLVGVEETSHTAQSRLVPILEDDASNPTLKSIEEAFNIEKVTKEFFEKYRDLYLRVKETLDEVLKNDKAIKTDFDAKNIDTVDFGKKLLGQIVFLYFLQKKGWFGVKRGEAWGSGSKNFLRELFDKKHGDYKNFFNDDLEPLFYEALRNDRSHDDHYFSMFKCKIPFLNGGLFDPINNYDWKETDIILPNDLFSNSYKTKEDDIGTGILDIFDRYNFTVKEDEPLEKEVAVDPEMLGKVFENLLEVKDRKSKGTYYTPREIVHYMCQESLVNYLATEFDKKVNKKDVETLIKYGETVVEHEAEVESRGKETKTYSHKLPKTVRDNAKLIDEKLETIRICDPAVGSGAFPVGMMNEIIRTRNALTSYLKTKRGRTIYDFKRHAIQNCLYGVDIDAGAVEICKLRFWLSLVVDENDIGHIKPLPNLDFKIMQGNSLVELLSGHSPQDSANQERTHLVNQIKDLKGELFETSSPQDKKKERQEIDGLVNELFEYDRNKQIQDIESQIFSIEHQGKLFEDSRSKKEDETRKQEYKSKIQELRKLKIPSPSAHFEWHINFSEVFQEKDGFDVVIANPPYVVSKKESYKRFEWNTDLYLMFFEISLKFLIRNSGVVCFISPRYFLTNRNSKSFRKFLLERVDLKSLLLTSPFDAVTENVVSIIKKESPESDDIIVYQEDNGLTVLSNKISKRYSLKNTYFEILTHLTDNVIDVLQKVENEITRLVEVVLIRRGAEIGKSHLREMEGEPALLGLEVGRYHIKPSNARIDTSHKEYRRLKGFFKQDNIIYLRRVAKEIISTISEDPMSFSKNIYGIKIKTGIALLPKYLLALLNSRLITFYYQNKFSTKKEKVFPEVQIYFLNELPIKVSQERRQESITNIVDKILAITKDDDYLENSAKQAKVRDYEKQIDQLVYKLYGLTPEEIKIVENRV